MLFGGLIDLGAITGAFEDLHPLRVQIAKQGSKPSPTGGLIPGAFVTLAGHESIPAQRSNVDEQETTTYTEARVTATHVWELLGAWPQIAVKSTLIDNSTGERHTVLYVDVHEPGIHTEPKTRMVSA